MKALKLFRGIAIKESEIDVIIDDIKSNGLYKHEKQQWEFTLKNLKDQIEPLFNKIDLKIDDTIPASNFIETKSGGHREFTEGENYICFADIDGASYYATKHNVNQDNKVSLLIEVEIDIDNIIIDGRDFLNTVFSLLDPKDISKTRRQTEKLKMIYGDKIELYIDKITNHPQSERGAICGLARMDNDIIMAHYRNREIIGGRHGTVFKSAFFGKIPLAKQNIKSVEIISKRVPDLFATLTLNDVLEQ